MSNRHGQTFGIRVTIRLVISWNEVQIEQEIGGWTAELYWVADDIQGGPTRVVIRPTDEKQVPIGGVSSTILRQINFRACATKARAKVAAEDLAFEQESEDEKPPQVAMPLLGAMLDTSGVTDVYLVLLATEYLARVARGDEKPVDRIAEELGRSLGTVKNHLWRARGDGFLKGGSAGRKGGYVPPDAAQIALDWLEQVDEAETIEVETPELLAVVEETPAKPKRRRPRKAITPRTET
jgi:hypothetical protein